MAAEQGHSGHHVVPLRVLASVFGTLVLLTVVTVVASRLDFGSFNVPLAIAIASTKSILVIAVFMALRYDNRVNSLVIFVGTLFVVVFLALTLADTALRGALGIMDAGVIPPTPIDQAGAPTDGALGPLADSITGFPDNEAVVSGEDGADLFTRFLCATCHSTDGTIGAGPTVQGIGAQQSLDALRTSILDPDANVVEGFASGVMKATLDGIGFYDAVTAEELDA